jgi:hypothetical protein
MKNSDLIADYRLNLKIFGMGGGICNNGVFTRVYTRICFDFHLSFRIPAALPRLFTCNCLPFSFSLSLLFIYTIPISAPYCIPLTLSTDFYQSTRPVKDATALISTGSLYSTIFQSTYLRLNRNPSPVGATHDSALLRLYFTTRYPSAPHKTFALPARYLRVTLCKTEETPRKLHLYQKFSISFPCSFFCGRLLSVFPHAAALCFPPVVALCFPTRFPLLINDSAPIEHPLVYTITTIP